MDIDNADCEYVRRALNVVQPSVVFVEILPDIPPPIYYAGKYAAPTDVGNLKIPRGCSLSAFTASAPGYSLVEVMVEDAVYVRNDLLPPFLFPPTLSPHGRRPGTSKHFYEVTGRKEIGEEPGRLQVPLRIS